MFRSAAKHCDHIAGVVNSAGVGLCRLAHEADEADFESDQSHSSARSLAHVACVHPPGSRRQTNLARSSIFLRCMPTRLSPGSSYASAKGGVEALTRGLAVECGHHGIRCNAVAPGYVHSEQGLHLLRTITDDPEASVQRYTNSYQALPYPIDPIDCGQLAVFLLSDASRCVTGQTIRIDCGLTGMLFDRDFSGHDTLQLALGWQHRRRVSARHDGRRACMSRKYVGKVEDFLVAGARWTSISASRRWPRPSSASSPACTPRRRATSTASPARRPASSWRCAMLVVGSPASASSRCATPA